MVEANRSLKPIISIFTEAMWATCLPRGLPLEFSKRLKHTIVIFSQFCMLSDFISTSVLLSFLLILPLILSYEERNWWSSIPD